MKITITVEGAEAGVPAYEIARSLAQDAQYQALRLDSVIITESSLGTVTASVIGEGRPASAQLEGEHPF